MGGLKKHLPITYWTFLIGGLAIAGIPPLAGFFSKDEILAAAAVREQWALCAVGLVTAGIDRLLHVPRLLPDLPRQLPRHARAEHHLHESPPSMTVPLWSSPSARSSPASPASRGASSGRDSTSSTPGGSGLPRAVVAGSRACRSPSTRPRPRAGDRPHRCCRWRSPPPASCSPGASTAGRTVAREGACPRCPRSDRGPGPASWRARQQVLRRRALRPRSSCGRWPGSRASSGRWSTPS